MLTIIEQKVSRGKLSFFAYVISGERSANGPKKLQNDAFQVKTSQSAKNQLDPAKNENRPKKRYTPFFARSPSIRHFQKIYILLLAEHSDEQLKHLYLGLSFTFFFFHLS